MTPSSTTSGVFRFGPYEFRPHKWELRKFGTVQKLPPQPARLLLLLLSNPGKVITREEIQQSVWGNDVNVDYELGVNRCIRQIRSILVDDPESPRYIKTIPRLGYTFIAAVEEASDAPFENPPAPVAAVENGVSAVTVEVPGPPAEALKPPRNWVNTLLWLGILLAAPMTAIGIWQYLLRPIPAPVVRGYSQLTTDAYGIVIKTGDLARPIYSDGNRVYFSAMTGAARSAIAQVSTNGGEVSLLPISLPSPVLLDLAPKRSEMLLASGGPVIGDLPLWVQPLPSGSPRRVTEVAVHGASWSPEGDRIVYASANALYLASATGGQPVLLAKFEGARRQRPYWPRWSPGGKQIRFSVFDGSQNSSSLWEIASAGGDARPVLPDPEGKHDMCCGSWTPDGRYYVFASSDGRRSDIWALAAQTGFLGRFKRPNRPIQLTAGPISYSAPAVSEDGKTLFVIGSAARGELVRYDSGSRDLLPLAPVIFASQADFSRDGKWIAFVSNDGSLWRAKSDGSGRSQISFSPVTAFLPRWSPNGSSIAFYGHAPGQADSIYVASDNNSLRRISLGTGHVEADPDWSGDGSRIVFSDTLLHQQSSSIVTMDLKTGSVTALRESHQLRSPRWSPDGQHIAALTSDLGSVRLYDVGSGNWRPLASFRMGYPNWSHDSRYLYVVKLSNGSAVCRIRVSDGAVEQVVDMAHRNQYWTSDAWLGLMPDDSPLLSRDISMQEIFALRLGSR